VGRMPIPKPLPGFIYGERRWRSVADNVIYTWDALHGEIEAYDSRRQYLGMSDDEYAVWLMSHGALPAILAARRGRQPARGGCFGLSRRVGAQPSIRSPRHRRTVALAAARARLIHIPG
jgi:hypothetical protein